MKTKLGLFLVAISFAFIACDDDTDDLNVDLQVPVIYSFERNGQSSVSYSGQTDRLKQLNQIKSKLKTADAGANVNALVLTDMYTNANGDGGGNFDFTSTKQLKDKTESSDQPYFEGLMASVALASSAGASGDTAVNGSPGLLFRGNDPNRTILVNGKGHEYTQFIEKGLMGSSIYYQMLSVYMSDARVGNTVENTALVSGKNYTAMEHHWDEAFGYLGAPVDFTSNWDPNRNSEAIFWANYVRGRDALMGSSDILMDAFKTGRAAIVAKEYEIKDAQRDIIYSEMERVSAATAVHYINSALAASNDDGERMHVLSEAYMFIRALHPKFNPKAKLSDAQITQLLKDISDDNFNFWNVTTNSLRAAKDLLSSTYNLEAFKNDL